MTRHDFDFEVTGKDAEEIERKAKDRADRFYGDRPYRLFIQSDVMWLTYDNHGFMCKAIVSASDAEVDR